MMKLLSYVPGKSLGWVETVRNIVSGVLEEELLRWPFLEMMTLVTKIKGHFNSYGLAVSIEMEFG